MAGVPHNHSLRDRAVKETTFGCFPSVMPQIFYYQFDNSAFHWSFCIELSSLTTIRFLTSGGNFGETCSVLSTGPLSNVNFFFIVIGCYFIYERNPNFCLVCRLLLNTIVPRQRGRFWMREPRPALRTIVDCQPFRYLFLRCLLS